MKGNRWSLIYIAGLIYIFSSCANRVTPTGGKKDEKPPAPQSFEPPNYSINFKNKKVVIDFDEYIQLNELQKQLIVSPLMDPPPVINAKKKSLIIELPENLRINTTYTLNFGKAIADIHENNAIESFQYVFSTGSILDSLFIKGKTLDAYKQKGEKGICVLLYRNFDDSLPLKSKPDYFARTNENGEFRMNNIGPGQYMMVALNDKNSNYICDSPVEEDISLSQLVVPDSNEVVLNYFTEQPTGLYIRKINYTGDKRWSVLMNKTSDSASLTPLNNQQPAYLESWSSGHDTVYIWCADTLQDSLYIKVLNSNAVVDTVRIELSKSQSAKSKGRGSGEAVNAKYFFIESSSASTGLKPFSNLEMLFKNPIVQLNAGQFLLKEDSVPVEKFGLTFSDTLRRKLLVTTKWKEERRYQLTLLPGAVVDFMGIANDTIQLFFPVKSSAEFGTLELMITDLPPGNFILQLIKGEAGVVNQTKITASGKYEFKALDPAKYRLCLVDDSNNNGRWDTGNYLKKIAPEKVYYYEQEITVRSNWELEQEWKIVR